MSERDPRIDPRPGDLLWKLGQHARVVATDLEPGRLIELVCWFESPDMTRRVWVPLDLWRIRCEGADVLAEGIP